MELKKYLGVIPAFYACYDDAGNVSPERTRALARYLLGKGVKGLYVGGSSGECIYQSVQERKVILENVMAEVGGKLTVIAHVACNNTLDSQELARHAESLKVDAIAAIPPIYFHDNFYVFFSFLLHFTYPLIIIFQVSPRTLSLFHLQHSVRFSL